MEEELSVSRKIIRQSNHKQKFYKIIVMVLTIVVVITLTSIFIIVKNSGSTALKNEIAQNSAQLDELKAKYSQQIETLKQQLLSLTDENKTLKKEIEKQIDKLTKQYESIAFDKCLLTVKNGIGNCHGHKLTYYNLNMAAFGPSYVDKYGFKRRVSDKKIMCACHEKYRGKSLVKGTICVDTGGFAATNSEQIDVATNW